MSVRPSGVESMARIHASEAILVKCCPRLGALAEFGVRLFVFCGLNLEVKSLPSFFGENVLYIFSVCR